MKGVMVVGGALAMDVGSSVVMRLRWVLWLEGGGYFGLLELASVVGGVRFDCKGV